jgi:lysozyme family protein
MAKLNLTDALRVEYKQMFDTETINTGKQPAVEGLIASLVANQARYHAVGDPLGMPWHVVAVIHNMESSQNFNKHLHNGDPLTARTTHVPVGRPTSGNPPFTWEQSATDALTLHGFPNWHDWTVAGTLYQLECYNGTGYRLYHPSVKTPYLWSFSNWYTAGKYIQDGTWSSTATSSQCGAAVLLRRMAEKQLIGFTDEPLPVADTPPLVVPYAAAKPSDPAVIAAAETFQTWLNTHAGIFVKVDGWAGQNSSNAFKAVTGHYLPGDPRG